MTMATSRFFPSNTVIRVIGAAILLLGLMAGMAARAADADGARAFVDKLGAQVQDIVKSPDISPADRQRRFKDIFTQAFDTPAIGRFVLGRHWQQTNPDEQQKFLDVMRSYVAAIYAQQFSNYRGQTFKTTGARSTGDGETLVQSQIDRQGQPPIRIAFRVRDNKIFDVSVEDVSLIVTKRDEFGSVLTAEGVPGVVKRMQGALDQMQAQAK